MSSEYHNPLSNVRISNDKEERAARNETGSNQ